MASIRSSRLLLFLLPLIPFALGLAALYQWVAPFYVETRGQLPWHVYAVVAGLLVVHGLAAALGYCFPTRLRAWHGVVWAVILMGIITVAAFAGLIQSKVFTFRAGVYTAVEDPGTRVVFLGAGMSSWMAGEAPFEVEEAATAQEVVQQPDPLVVITNEETERADINALLESGFQEMEDYEVLFNNHTIWSRQEAGSGEAAGRPDEMRFVFLGDSGAGSEELYAIVDLIVEDHREKPLSGVILLGDNVYRNDVGSGEDALDAAIFTPFAPLMEAGVPFYAVLGNHDYDEPHFWQQQIADPRLNMDGKFFYDVRPADGFVHFFMLDTERLGTEPFQEEWLEKRLNISTAPWKIVITHKPAVSITGGSPIVRAALNRARAGHYGVDMVVSGDDHFYDKWQTGSGALQLVLGGGSDVNSKERDPLPGQLAFYEKEESYGLVGFREDRAHVVVRNYEGALVDSFYLLQDGSLERAETSVPLLARYPDE